MIDIHSHVLHEVDDGARSLEEAAAMVRAAEEAGIGTLFATPHLKELQEDPDRIERRFRELEEKVADRYITLLLGYEVCLDAALLEAILGWGSYTLGGTRYLLMEFPFSGIPPKSREAVYRLKQKGIQPILAHPERYPFLNRDPERLVRYREAGCHIQVDAASITGDFGKKAKACARLLIENGLADYVASDAHKASDYSTIYKSAYEQVQKWVGRWKADSLFCSNAVPIIRSTAPLPSFSPSPVP